MTPSKRSSYKARTTVRVVDKDLHQAEVRFPDGAIVQTWLVGGKVRITNGDTISGEEMEILSEKVREAFPEQSQIALFG